MNHQEAQPEEEAAVEAVVGAALEKAEPPSRPSTRGLTETTYFGPRGPPHYGPGGGIV